MAEQLPSVPDEPAQMLDGDSFAASAGNAAEKVADAVLRSEAGASDRIRGETPVVLEAPRRPATTRRRRDVMASPLVTMPRVAHPEAIALFIHGGDVTGTLRMWRGDPAYLRVVPFARDVERRTQGRIGGAVLRFAVRGWNDPEKPAVEDARWALAELRRRYPGRPIAVVGHSMGGRVVLDLAGTEDLAAIVALAPWASDEYAPEPFLGTPLLTIHGDRDRVTDPEATDELVARIVAEGGDAEHMSMPGGHSMLWRADRWHEACSSYLARRLLTP